jgi:hypothetical protein
MGITAHVHSFPANTQNDNIRDVEEVRDIESLSLNEDHVIGLTKFSNEAVSHTVADSGTPVVPFEITDDKYQDVKEYFARPRLISKITASTTRSNIYASFVSEPISNFWPAVAVNRLNGVYGYRCTMKFTLTLAATPFQQGLSCVAFQYGTDVDDGTDRIPYRFNYIPLVTNLPHARLNFADNTIAELDIPYFSPFEFFEYANKVAGGGDAASFTYGHLSVSQLLPYVITPGATAPIMSLYISLHDMELFGAVPAVLNAIIPQSAISTMNAEAKKTKVASKTLSKVSKVSDTVSRVAGALGVPFLGAAATGVSWLSEKLAGTAKSFGYSKPIDESSPSRCSYLVSALDSAVDVADVSVPVAPFINNRLDVGPLSTEVDELSLPYVLGKYAQCFVGTVSTTYTDGTFVYASRLCPTNFWFRTNSGTPGGNLTLPVSATLTTNAFQPTALAYVGSMFRLWRGGLKFRFTFAKTKFHAGRMVATFVPCTADVSSATPPSSIVPLPEVSGGGIQPFTCSAIFDLKDDSVFEFEVPYIAARPWLSTYGSSGGISLGILDQLRTTNATVSDISFMVEVAAMDDFEFANFAGPSLLPAAGSTVDTDLVELQSNIDSIVASDDKLMEVCQYTIGEKFTSLKEVIQIPAYTQATVAATTTSFYPLPRWGHVPRGTFSVPFVVSAPTKYWNLPGGFVASMYAFCSGGTTYHLYSNNTLQSVSVRQSANDFSVDPVTLSDPRNRGNGVLPRHYTCGSTATALHFKTPSYQKTPVVPTGPFTNSRTNTVLSAGANFPLTGSKYLNSVYQLTYSNLSAGTATITLGTAASDDAKCFQYIGPPPVILPASTSTSRALETLGTL